MEEYHNRYSKVDNVLEKTIRYRQMVGLLASSSIRSFRKRPRSGSTTTKNEESSLDITTNAPSITTTTTTFITPSTNMNSTRNRIDTTNDSSSATNQNNSIPTCTDRCVEQTSITPATTTSRKQQRVATDKVPVKKNHHLTNKIEPIAIDVIQYLFHNNNNNYRMKKNNDIENRNNNHVRQSNIIEQQQQQQQHNQFNMDQHHPGYIPIDLWKDYVLLENNRNQNIYANNNLHVNDVKNKRTMVEADEDKEVGNNERHNNVEDTKRSTALLQFAPVCFDCGGIIQPGVMDTTIQMVDKSSLDIDSITATTTTSTTSLPSSSLSRTQRRRESRLKGKLHLKQHHGTKQLCRMTQGNNITKTSKQSQPQHPSSKSKLWQYIWQQQNKYYHNQPSTDIQRIYPFLNCCKNNNSFDCDYYYIITCGSCGVQIYISGNNNDTYNPPPKKIRSNINMKKRNIDTLNDTTPVKITQLENNKKQRDIYVETSSVTIVDKDVDATTTDNNSSLLNGPERTSSNYSSNISDVSTTSNDGVGINSNNNNVKVQRAIIETTPTTTTKPVQQQQRTLMSQSHGNPNSLTLLNPPRTTKKKKSKQQKNDLMSFLSSLNDR